MAGLCLVGAVPASASAEVQESLVRCKDAGWRAAMTGSSGAEANGQLRSSPGFMDKRARNSYR